MIVNTFSMADLKGEKKGTVKHQNVLVALKPFDTYIIHPYSSYLLVLPKTVVYNTATPTAV